MGDIINFIDYHNKEYTRDDYKKLQIQIHDYHEKLKEGLNNSDTRSEYLEKFREKQGFFESVCLKIVKELADNCEESCEVNKIYQMSMQSITDYLDRKNLE